MKIYFDTEFYEDGKTIDLMSIGMVREDGHELYLINGDCDWRAPFKDNWHQQNTLPFLLSDPNHPTPVVSQRRIRELVLLFCGVPVGYLSMPQKKHYMFVPEFWAYYADYDWVVLCQLFGRMVDLPDGWPMYCLDFKQYIKGSNFGLEDNPSAHNALEDARWLKKEKERFDSQLVQKAVDAVKGDRTT